jgi:hypothetical protein
MNARKLTLKRTTLRVLKAADLEQVAGGWTTTTDESKICPPPSMYTGCAACVGTLPNPSIVINPVKK